MAVRDLWHTCDGGRTARYGQGRRWLATWTGPDGKRYSKAFASRAHATQCEAAMLADAVMQRSLGLTGGDR